MDHTDILKGAPRSLRFSNPDWKNQKLHFHKGSATIKQETSTAYVRSQCTSDSHLLQNLKTLTEVLLEMDRILKKKKKIEFTNVSPCAFWINVGWPVKDASSK